MQELDVKGLSYLAAIGGERGECVVAGAVGGQGEHICIVPVPRLPICNKSCHQRVSPRDACSQPRNSASPAET